MADRILIVEDEEKLNRMIELELKYEGYETGKALDGRTGLDMALSGGYDLVLLDIMLPGLKRAGGAASASGRRTSACQSSCSPPGTPPWTRCPAWTPAQTTMSQSPSPSRSCWPASAPPCASTPRLRRLRRKRTPIRCRMSGWRRTPRRVLVNGAEVKLTRKEFDLLECLMEHRGKVMDRSSLLEQVWGYDFAGETNSVDVVVRFLRSKIDEPYGLTLIETVRGVGYVIR